MATKYIVNNLSGQTINGQQLQPYKVYTALLTQSGGDDPDSINTGQLTIGVSYFINDNSPGMDFSNVGAPNNNVGTYFVATGTNPNSWGEYEGNGDYSILTYNLGAPVVTVLENTLGGDVIWSYSDTGAYLGTIEGGFPLYKTFLQGHSISEDGGSYRVTSLLNIPPNSILVTSTYPVETFIQNDILNMTPIEIRVYN
jgi:hypothetical protein